MPSSESKSTQAPHSLVHISVGFVASMLALSSLLGGGILALCVGLGLENLVGESVPNIALSFALGFVGNVCVVGSSFLALLKQVDIHISESHTLESTSQADSENSEIRPSQEGDTRDDLEGEPHDEKSPKGSFVSRFLVGTRLSASLLRLISLGAFGGGLAWLLISDKMALFALFTGLVCALCALCGIGLGIIRNTRQKSQNVA